MMILVATVSGLRVKGMVMAPRTNGARVVPENVRAQSRAQDGDGHVHRAASTCAHCICEHGTQALGVQTRIALAAMRAAAAGVRRKHGKGHPVRKAQHRTHMDMRRYRGGCDRRDHTRVQPSQGVVASGIVRGPPAQLCVHSTENDASAHGLRTE